MEKEMIKLRRKKMPLLVEWVPEEINNEIVSPLTDIEEDEDEIIVKFDIPRMNKEDIKINLTKNKIEIKSEKKNHKIENKKYFYKEERSYKGFYRSLILPAEIIPEKSETRYIDNFFIVRMPKLKQTNKITQHRKKQ